MHKPNFDTFIGPWIWLFPLTYLVHIAEEFWGGEGFYRWVARVAGGGLSAERFLQLNALCWATMAACVALVYWTRSNRWLVVAFAAVVLLNGTLHLMGTFVTRAYSPGLVSGLLLWVPLGAAALRRAWLRAPRATFAAGVTVGLVMHALVSLSAFNLTRR